ncbi:hypothetical protein [Hoeflea sp.]|uniref:hypothetical protein n=1 Tax=Hoeflea sp. TaxID=1940281 RepID=UPI0019A36C0E|nr:hypothetical protein [Hoeflea sp.]MBC7280795.1 hypothetical protein [Hoeflea sp.]
MSVIQAVSYPVSAVLQSQQQVPSRDGAGHAASKAPAAPAAASTDLAAVSSRVNAYLAIEQAAGSGGTRPDQHSPDPEASDAATGMGDAVDVDDAQIYQPSSRY